MNNLEKVKKTIYKYNIQETNYNNIIYIVHIVGEKLS